MNITIEELLKGKPTRIKGKEYFRTEAYVTPFLERMSKYTNDFSVQVRLPDQISLTQEGEVNAEDVVYNRVYIQAILPEDLNFFGHKEVIGMVYGLDVRKPIVKLFKSGLNMACLNLCIFNPSFLHVQELEPEKAINYKSIEYLMSQTSDIVDWLKKLSNIEVPYDETLINESLGRWVRNTISASYDNGYGKVKLATSTAVDAYKLLYEKEDSPYYVGKGNSTDMFNVYNSFTELICNTDTKDIINKQEKVLLLREILNIA